MIGQISTGITKAELRRIILRSERPEETGLDADTLSALPDVLPDAVVLRIDGVAVAAGGSYTPPGSHLAILWITACVDLTPYRFPLMRHARRVMALAKKNGLNAVSLVPSAVERAKNPSVHLGLTARGVLHGQAVYA